MHKLPDAIDSAEARRLFRIEQPPHEPCIGEGLRGVGAASRSALEAGVIASIFRP